MLESLKSVDWEALLEHVSNDRIVAIATSTWGLIALGLLLVLSIVLRWRLIFVFLSASFGVGLLAHTTVLESTALGKKLFVFAGGGIAVAAFVIYQLFVKDE